MQFLIMLERNSDRFSEADFAPLLEPESRQARQLYAEGVLRQIWHRSDVRGACLLMEAVDEAAIRGHLDTLPLVQRDMLKVQIVPLRPYAGFAS